MLSPGSACSPPSLDLCSSHDALREAGGYTGLLLLSLFLSFLPSVLFFPSLSPWPLMGNCILPTELELQTSSSCVCGCGWLILSGQKRIRWAVASVTGDPTYRKSSTQRNRHGRLVAYTIISRVPGSTHKATRAEIAHIQLSKLLGIFSFF